MSLDQNFLSSEGQSHSLWRQVSNLPLPLSWTCECCSFPQQASHFFGLSSQTFGKSMLTCQGWSRGASQTAKTRLFIGFCLHTGLTSWPPGHALLLSMSRLDKHRHTGLEPRCFPLTPSHRSLQMYLREVWLSIGPRGKNTCGSDMYVCTVSEFSQTF